MAVPVPDHADAYRSMIAAAEMLCVTTLKGLSIDIPCEVADGIFLVPFAAVPDGAHKRDSPIRMFQKMGQTAAWAVYPKAAMLTTLDCPAPWLPKGWSTEMPMYARHMDRHRAASDSRAHPSDRADPMSVLSVLARPPQAAVELPK